MLLVAVKTVSSHLFAAAGLFLNPVERSGRIGT
jgi:hypothetical protein